MASFLDYAESQVTYFRAQAAKPLPTPVDETAYTLARREAAHRRTCARMAEMADMWTLMAAGLRAGLSALQTINAMWNEAMEDGGVTEREKELFLAIYDEMDARGIAS